MLVSVCVAWSGRPRDPTHQPISQHTHYVWHVCCCVVGCMHVCSNTHAMHNVCHVYAPVWLDRWVGWCVQPDRPSQLHSNTHIIGWVGRDAHAT